MQLQQQQMQQQLQQQILQQQQELQQQLQQQQTMFLHLVLKHQEAAQARADERMASFVAMLLNSPIPKVATHPIPLSTLAYPATPATTPNPAAAPTQTTPASPPTPNVNVTGHNVYGHTVSVVAGRG